MWLWAAVCSQASPAWGVSQLWHAETRFMPFCVQMIPKSQMFISCKHCKHHVWKKLEVQRFPPAQAAALCTLQPVLLHWWNLTKKSSVEVPGSQAIVQIHELQRRAVPRLHSLYWLYWRLHCDSWLSHVFSCGFCLGLVPEEWEAVRRFLHIRRETQVLLLLPTLRPCRCRSCGAAEPPGRKGEALSPEFYGILPSPAAYGVNGFCSLPSQEGMRYCDDANCRTISEEAS